VYIESAEDAINRTGLRKNAVNCKTIATISLINELKLSLMDVVRNKPLEIPIPILYSIIPEYSNL
jgi:hypothetical protein